MSLSVYTGPMFSGKTTRLIEEITRLNDILGLPAIIVNHIIDIRDKDNIVSSHSSNYKGLSKKIKVIFLKNLSDLDIKDYNIIGIDEACFFDDLYTNVNSWVSSGKNIVCSGLDSTFQMKPFGQIHELLHIADKFTKLSAICSECLKELISKGEVITPYNTVPAPFTRRISNSQTLEDIGGSEKYIPVCRKHHK